MTSSSASTRLRVLLVEDNRHDRIAFRRAFKKNGVALELKEYLQAEEALEFLQQHPDACDIVVSDHKLPGMTGLELCQELLRAEIAVPLVLLTGRGSEHLAVKALKTGVHDYLIKDPAGGYLALLPVVLPEVVQQFHDRQERQRAEAALQRLNAELEDRVKERTAALHTANRELQEALEKLEKTQEHLIQNEKMTLLITLVAGIVHELNNPLGVGLTAASFLEQETQTLNALYQQQQMKRSDLENYLRTALNSTTILLNNLQRAAEYAQSVKQVTVDQASGKQRTFALKRYLEEVLLSLQPKLKRTHHTVTIHCPEDLTITSYPGAFSQIFSNLILNSLIHGFEGHKQGKIVIDIRLSQDMLDISYQDNGNGMKPDDLEKIFDPFFTTRQDQGGSGLGMNIVYNLITQKLRGTITCESTPGKGLTCRIRLPLM